MARVLGPLDIVIATGSQVFGPLTVPNNVHRLIIRLARNTSITPLIWPLASTTIDCQVEGSFDSGSTFRPIFGFTAVGGILPNRDGGELEETTAQMTLPDRTPPETREIRTTLTVDGGPLVSRLTVDID